MGIDRREFLRGAALLGGSALVAPRLAGCMWAPPPGLPSDFVSLINSPAYDSPITHVVVVMMENRSFDHWLGWLAEDDAYLAAGQSRYGGAFSVEGVQQQSYDDGTGPISTAHLVGNPDQPSPYQGCGFGDPGHGWNAGRAQRDHGFLAAGSGNDPFALGYYLGGDLPFTASLAKRFTTFDHSHASVLGPTYPNREYLNSGQSGGHKDNAFPDSADGFAWETIWDRFGAAGVPAKTYYSDLPILGLWGERMSPYVAPITQYYEDCAAGALPNVTFLDPTFLGDGQEDDHPLADIRAGQGFLRRVFKAFHESEHWEHGLFLITYDEWGGFFDHVAPPTFNDDRASAVDADNFGQAGFRVPTIVASPYAQTGFVDHRVYDHTSILRFLEWRFLGAPADGPGKDTDTWFLTKRDRYAQNIGASLSRTLIDADLHFDIDGLNIGTPAAPCATGAGTLLTNMVDEGGGSAKPATRALTRADFPPTIFETTFASGYFEKVGIPILGQ